MFLLPSLATAEDLDRIISVNLRGTFLCYKYAGLQMMAQGRGGRIIGKNRPSSLPLLRNLPRSGLLSYRRVFWHGQAGTSISQRLFSKQIWHPSFDSVCRCVFLPRFRCCSRAKRLRSLGVRSAPHYRQRLCSRTRQDTNVYVSSPSSKNMFLTGTYQGTISNPRLVAPQEYSRSRYAWS